MTNGITNTGSLSNSGALSTGTLAVSGASATNGISNTGAIATTTLGVSGASVTNGITNAKGLTNTGGMKTDTLTVTGLSTTNGITNNGNLATQSLDVSGNANTNGINNNNNKITGVAAGSAWNDAVNMGQLNSVRKRLNAGVAGAVAMANVPSVEAGKTFSLGIGVGSYAGETAMSVGASYRVSGGWVARTSLASDSRGQISAGGGASYSW